MSSKSLMLQGTSSDVGKSVLVAGLCRLYARRGIKVAPFKAQNMALNSYVTIGGEEMGRAQVSQARAAGLEPTVEMNPLLLKPEGNSRSQIVLMGHPVESLSARDFYKVKSNLWEVVRSALDRLRESYDLVLIEGAGSPAEINLKKDDIVNMRVAKYLKSPVMLVGDIDRGGVFASLYGTLALLDEEERNLVSGFIINKFRGDLSLLEPGLDMLKELTSKDVLGVVPYLEDHGVAQEDSVYIERNKTLSKGSIDIVAIKYPRTSNYDDLDPLAMEPDVGVRFVSTVEELGRPDAVILPGSKSTISDLIWMRENGLERELISLKGSGVPIVGICGGYQMMGSVIRDISRVESAIDQIDGMGILPVSTDFQGKKRVQRTEALLDNSNFDGTFKLSGYEIHMGVSIVDGENLLSFMDGRRDGAVDRTSGSFGTYLHGLFDQPDFRRAWLISLGWIEQGEPLSLADKRERAFDRLADVLEDSLDMDRLDEIIGL